MTTIPHRLLRPAGSLLLVALVGAGCGSDDGSGSGSGPAVVVTTSILGDLVRQVAGDQATVTVLMDAGVDPHEFQPSARDAEALVDADLVVANGGGLEAGLLDALDGARGEGIRVLELLDEVDPLEGGHDDGHTAGDEAEGDDHGDHDPHFWHDPRRVARAVELVGASLAELVEAGGGDGPVERAESYAAEVLAADAEIEALLGDVPAGRHALVTDHDAFGYFADRYGFEVVGVVIPGGGTSGQASAADLARLAEEVRRHDVPAVFAENTVSPRLATALAGEVGSDVEVVTLFSDALGAPDSGASTYLDMIRTNAERVAEALG